MACTIAPLPAGSRGPMHAAALTAKEYPGRLSFLHSVRVVRRKLPVYNATPPRQGKPSRNAVLAEIRQERAVCSRSRRNLGGVKRKLSSFPLRPRKAKPSPPIDIHQAIRVIS